MNGNFQLILEDCLGCCCPTAEDSSVDMANDGFTSCGVFFDAGTGKWYKVESYTPAGTTLDIITPGTSEFVGTIGTISVQEYTDGTGTVPVGAPFDVDVKGFASCDGSGWFRTITAPGSVLPAGGIAYSATGGLGVDVPNDLDCGDGIAWTMDTTNLTLP